MKMVVAFVEPQQLPAVKEALFEAQIRYLTATNILGTAASGAEVYSFRGVAHEVSLFQKVRIELAIREEMVEVAVNAIEQAARDTGGFGIIFVIDLHDVVLVATGERGDRALG